jgi:hypothetical protein
MPANAFLNRIFLGNSWASRFASQQPYGCCSLASGYPLHHPLRAFHALRGWFRYYPSR